MRLGLRYTALSDVGGGRYKENQDSGYAGPHLLAVADGVGGAARGDLASSTAIDQMRRLDEPAPNDLLEAVAGALHRAHDRIAELVEQDRSLQGTSTTVTVALFDGTRLGIGHVGDSRMYLLRDGTLTQLTKDHTFVQGLIDEGRISEDEAKSHPHRNMILKAIDAVHEVEPDLFVVEVAAGDRLLLCSDGASGVLDEDHLTEILSGGTLDFVAVELIRSALEAGSGDNITVVVADVVDEDEAVEDETYAAASTGPMIVGAAADQPRLKGARGFWRGHRSGDTGELEPVSDEADEATTDRTTGAFPPAVDPEEVRYAPRPPERRWPRRVLLLALLLALLVGAAAAAYSWTQQQFYVATAGDKVAIYRGVDAELPGLSLRSVEETTVIEVANLPEYNATQVRQGIEATSLEDARRIVSRLEERVECPSPEPSPSPSPSPAQPSPSKATKPTPTPSPTPTPTPPDCDLP